jgi:hypothetical protein
MGYYTRYGLEYEPKRLGEDQAIQQRMEKLWDGEYNPFDEACKWYGNEGDMKKLSLEFPTVLFTLSGEGEEAGDIWKKYFRNGKIQIANAKITVAEFNPKELK